MDKSRKTPAMPLIGVMPGSTLSAPGQINGCAAPHPADLPSIKVSALSSADRLDTPGKVSVAGRRKMDRHLFTTVRVLVPHEPGVSAIGGVAIFGLAKPGIRSLDGKQVRTEIDAVAVADTSLSAVRSSIGLDAAWRAVAVRDDVSAVYTASSLVGRQRTRRRCRIHRPLQQRCRRQDWGSWRLEAAHRATSSRATPSASPISRGTPADRLGMPGRNESPGARTSF